MSEAWLRSRLALSSEGARSALQASIDAAISRGLKMSVAVVDDAGHLISFQRLEGAITVSIDAAAQKARTAAQTGVNTRLLQQIIDRDMPSLLAVSQIMPVPGGVPMIIHGSVIGAVGASGGSLCEDEAVAQVGVDHIVAALDAASVR